MYHTVGDHDLTLYESLHENVAVSPPYVALRLPDMQYGSERDRRADDNAAGGALRGEGERVCRRPR